MTSNLFHLSPELRVEIPTLQIPNFTNDNPPLAPRAADSRRCCHPDCKKKLTLSDFACKCGKKHCSSHRIPEAHACTYDYKAQQREVLLKTMSTPVVAKKIDIL
jgi:predicted nucleic acid binding AN1-type Zn finger protein